MSVTTRITDDDIGRGTGQGALLPLGLSSDDVNCPICVETISDPFVTSCGHTFCYQCISTQLKHKNSCPSCGGYLTADNIYPNFLLNKILRKAATAPLPGRGSLLDHVQRLLADNMAPDPPAAGSLALHHHHRTHQAGYLGHGGAKGLTAAAAAGPLGSAGAGGGSGSGRLRLRLRDIDAVLEALYEAREELERRESSDALHLLLCFLQHAREHKARQMAGLRQQLALLEHDILAVTTWSSATAATATTVTAAGDASAEASVGTRTGAGAGTMMAPLPMEVEGASPEVEPVVVDPVAAPAVHETGPLGGRPPPEPYPRPQGPPQQQQQHPASEAAPGAWLRRAKPHLDEGDGGGSSGDGSVGAAAAPPPPPPPAPDGAPQQAASREEEEDGSAPGPAGRRPQGLHRTPLRRASWCFHTITPGGGISSVTVDTSSLLEPGQQAEAFGAAVQHALAAARGGDGRTAGQPRPPPAAAAGMAEGQDSRTGVAAMAAAAVAAVAAVSAASGGTGVVAELEGPMAASRPRLVGSGEAGPCSTTAVAGGARRGLPRCGSADNFRLLSGQTAAAAASQPSTSGDGGASGAGGGGADDSSVLSGSAFPPRETAVQTSPRPHRPQQSPQLQQQQPPQAQQLLQPPRPARPADEPSSNGTRRDGGGVASVAGAASAAPARRGAAGLAATTAEPHLGPTGAGGGGPPATQQAASRRGREVEDSSEDEMDVRERRRGRGRVGPAVSQQPPPPQQQQQQPRAVAAAVAAAAHTPTTGGTAMTTVAAIAAADADVSAMRGARGQGLHPRDSQDLAEAREEDPAAMQAAKRRRMLSQFDLLERCYLQMRAARTSASAGGLTSLQREPSPPAATASAVGGPWGLSSTPPQLPWLMPQLEQQPLHPHIRPLQALQQTRADPFQQHLQLLNGDGDWGTGASTSLLLPPPLSGSRLGGDLAAGAMSGGAGACGGAHPHRGPSGPGGLCTCEGDLDVDAGGGGDPDLETFGAVLAAATQYSRLELLAEIPRHGSGSGSGGSTGGLNILSSIEFDMSDDLFATAGVVPRILVYDYQALLARGARPRRPVTELSARSKLSCLSYSRGVRQHLLAADYLGGVALWDTEAGMQVQDYEAHERRVWGVDFSPSPASHHCFASGSDDGLVKVWSTRQPGSCMALELRGNVCSVEWHPTHPHLLAVGSALHCAAVYDLRQPAAPLHTLLGHRRAVSYVRWLSNRHELVTASTDSTLKLWSLSPPRPPSPTIPGVGPTEPADRPSSTAAAAAASAAAPSAAPPPPFRGAELVRTFSGHVNERNFVGLCTEGDFLACGSESHEVFVYHRSLPQPALRFSFAGRMIDGPGGPQHANLPGAPGPQHQRHPHHSQHQQQPGAQSQQPNHFVTALQWRRNSPHLLAANSAGYIWLLGLRL